MQRSTVSLSSLPARLPQTQVRSHRLQKACLKIVNSYVVSSHLLCKELFPWVITKELCNLKCSDGIFALAGSLAPSRWPNPKHKTPRNPPVHCPALQPPRGATGPKGTSVTHTSGQCRFPGVYRYYSWCLTLSI